MSIVDHWPLFGLRISTERLELRVPTDDDLAEMLEVARLGIHDPAIMPFLFPWTDQASPQFERSFFQFHWGCRARWTQTSWDLNFVVVVDGKIVGSQGIAANNFPSLRSVETGSWLGREFQGHGIGKAMRSAVASFAFEHLNAERVTSTAFFDNPASQHVSLATGYKPNGTTVTVRRGVSAESRHFVLERQYWEANTIRKPIVVEGFEACRPLFE